MSDTAIAEPVTRTRITPVMWGLRVNAILITAVVLAQPLWIGLLFTGEVWGAIAHGMGAGGVLLFGLIHLVLSILRWKPGGGTRKGIWGSLEFLGLIAVQAVLGVFQLYPLHFPIGVLMAVGVVSLVKETWQDGAETAKGAAA